MPQLILNDENEKYEIALSTEEAAAVMSFVKGREKLKNVLLNSTANIRNQYNYCYPKENDNELDESRCHSALSAIIVTVSHIDNVINNQL